MSARYVIVQFATIDRPDGVEDNEVQVLKGQGLRVPGGDGR